MQAGSTPTFCPEPAADVCVAVWFRLRLPHPTVASTALLRWSIGDVFDGVSRLDNFASSSNAAAIGETGEGVDIEFVVAAVQVQCGLQSSWSASIPLFACWVVS